MNTLIRTLSTTLIASVLTFSVAHAELKLQAKPVPPKPMGNIAEQGAAKPPACAPGFTPVGMKLQNHEGKKWYEYTCAKEETINRTCNADTSVIDVKDQFISLPSDEQSKKSKLQMSYKCYNYVPVK